MDNLILSRLQSLADAALRLNLPEKDRERLFRLDEISSFDSLARIEFLMAIEREFGFRLEPALMTGEFLADLREVARHISSRTQLSC